ncbi:MAG TPA: hypothetical protein VKP30_28555, partial [Polyangiaceae bacterium]|nr:hypothetical protein [Polyangiaceae bacterium]
EVPTNSERVRFYMNRLDVSNPSAPLLDPPVNTPGAVVTFDEMSGRAVTLDYLEAYGGPVVRLVDTGPASLDSAIILGSTALEANQDVFSVVQGDNRVFAAVQMPVRTWLADTDCLHNPDCVIPPTEQPLIVLGGFRTGRFETGRITLNPALLIAGGRSAMVSVGSQLLVVDAADVSAPRIVDQFDVPSAPQLLESVHGVAIALSRYGGVQVFPLPK